MFDFKVTSTVLLNNTQGSLLEIAFKSRKHKFGLSGGPILEHIHYSEGGHVGMKDREVGILIYVRSFKKKMKSLTALRIVW